MKRCDQNSKRGIQSSFPKALVVILLTLMLIPGITYAATIDTDEFTMRGVFFMPRNLGHSSSETYDLLEKARRLGCNWIDIFVEGRMRGDDHTTYTLVSYPTDAELTSLVNKIHSLNMKVQWNTSALIRPHYPGGSGLDENGDIINPTSFFDAYKSYIYPKAELCETLGVDLMCWGSEMGKYMNQHKTDWQNIIAGIRERYSGPIYCTQQTLEDWQVDRKIEFINDNDYHSLNMYQHLTKMDHNPIDYNRTKASELDPTAAELMEDWDDFLTLVEDFRSTNNITVPLIYGEVGYVSWDCCNSKYKFADLPLDIQEQADCIEAMLMQAQKRDYIHGMDWWCFEMGTFIGGSNHPMHEIAGKPAQDVFAREYLRVDRFEHYDDSTDLNGEWTDVNSNVTMTLETTEVKRGAQSMKIAATTTSSDAVVRYDTSKVGCWDLGDSNPALTFWFKGDAGLSGNIEVKLETTTQTIGTATYTNGASQTSWTRWEIDLDSDLSGGTGVLTNVDYVSIIIPQGSGSGTIYVDDLIRLPLKAVALHPLTSGATGVYPQDDLIWRSGYDAVSHNVYFGKNQTNVANATTSSDEYLGNFLYAMAPLGQMEENTTYYWRVDEIDVGSNVATGSVWSFTTSANYLETFEDYTAEEQIDRMWIGSNVVSSNITTTEKHNGSQALAVTYDDSINTSSIKRICLNDWPRANWHLEGSGFSFWLKGDAGNTGTLYVQLKHDYNGGRYTKEFTNALTTTSWTKYEITSTELADVDLRNITQIVFKVSPDTSGVYYLDDIRRVVSKASMPSPGDGEDAVNHTTTTKLCWARGVDAASHDVYFGTSKTAVENATKQSDEYKGNNTGTKYHLNESVSLSDDTSYFWRIDVVTASDTIKGDVWSFDTRAPILTKKYRATDTVFVDKEYPDTNHNDHNHLLVTGLDATYPKRTYLQFEVTGLLDTTVEKAMVFIRSDVRYYPTTDVEIYEVSNNSWDETTMTWNTMKAFGNKLDTYPGANIKNKRYKGFDVSDSVTGNGTYSFGLRSNSTEDEYFDSENVFFPVYLYVDYRQSDTQKYNPSDDVHVKKWNPETNYGSETTLTIRGEGNATIYDYLKFVVSGLPAGNVTNATLKIYSNDVNMTVTAYPVSDTTWTEGAIVWNNMPAMGGTSLDSAVVGISEWVEFDVRNHVTGNGTFSLGLQGSLNEPNHDFSSKEGSNDPVLEVTWEW